MQNNIFEDFEKRIIFEQEKIIKKTKLFMIIHLSLFIVSILFFNYKLLFFSKINYIWISNIILNAYFYNFNLKNLKKYKNKLFEYYKKYDTKKYLKKIRLKKIKTIL